jgi:Holliday junction resolvase RusA-like endonuclease
VDSGVKAVMDAIFNHIGLNDNLVVQLISKKFDDRENPRVEVALSCVIGR